jgi:hypothetical protein
MQDLIDGLRAKGEVTGEDVLSLRRAVFSDDAVSRAEAEALFALNDAAPQRCPEWDAFFVEALTDIVVRQQSPAGYVDQAQADWLTGLIGCDGACREIELELLIRILETAELVPADLTAFTLACIRDAALASGPRIGAADVARLRRALYAAAGDGNIAITRAEAEVLFDLNDACRGADNDPAWTPLFAKAIAASIMMVSGYAPLAREEAARRTAWLEAPAPGLGETLGRIFDLEAGWRAKREFRKAVVEVWTGRTAERLWDQRQDAVETASRAAEAVSAEEAAWLAGRIGRDGAFDPAERAVIDFLRRESPSLDPALQPLLDA